MDDRAPTPTTDTAARDAASRRSARADGVALVVTGYDGSEEAAEAVRWAGSLARRTGSTLRVMWAWKIRDVWDAAVAADATAISPPMADLERVARARLTEAVAGLLGPDHRDVELDLRQGPDAAGLLLYTAADADLLVVGSRGRGRTMSAVLGSVSARCVHESRVPVLVIPHRMAPPPADDRGPVAAAHAGGSGQLPAP